jgi:hypothetical protein
MVLRGSHSRGVDTGHRPKDHKNCSNDDEFFQCASQALSVKSFDEGNWHSLLRLMMVIFLRLSYQMALGAFYRSEHIKVADHKVKGRVLASSQASFENRRSPTASARSLMSR